MFRLKIIAVGKLTEGFYREAAGEYLKRMERFYEVSVAEVKPERLSSAPSSGEIERALSAEEKRILGEVPSRAAVIVCAVEGREYSSDEFASMLERYRESPGELAVIIGSSYGLSAGVKSSADALVSVSRMTFPHELFRVMFLEQLYRAGEIAAGSKYHK